MIPDSINMAVINQNRDFVLSLHFVPKEVEALLRRNLNKTIKVLTEDYHLCTVGEESKEKMAVIRLLQTVRDLYCDEDLWLVW